MLVGLLLVNAVPCSLWAGNEMGVPAAGLSAWFREQQVSGSTGTIALLGIQPSPSLRSARLKIGEVSGQELSAPDRAHTALAGWILDSLPAIQLICIPLSQDADEQRMAAALEEALKYKPDVIYVPATVFPAEGSTPKTLNDVVIRSWEQEALIFTITKSSEHKRLPEGMLAIHLASEAPGSTPKQSAPLFPGAGPRSVALPAELFRNRDEVLAAATTEDMAAAYLAMMLTVLPTKGTPAHLERAARFALSTRPAAGSSPQYGGSFDAQRALHPDKSTFNFEGRECTWSKPVRDFSATDMVGNMTRPPGKAPGVVVVTAVRGDTPVRWLHAATFLSDSSPVLFVPQKSQGIYTLRSRSSHAKGGDSILEELLSTQEGEGAERPGIFNVVIKDPPKSSTQ